MKTSVFDPDSRSISILGPEIHHQLKTIRRAVPYKSGAPHRFAFYGYLHTVYKIYHQWRRQGQARKISREVARASQIPRRKGVSPIRILIEATFMEASAKQKSRWVRALEYACDEHIAPERLILFFKANGGVAGCAARAAQDDPKKRTDRNDWA